MEKEVYKFEIEAGPSFNPVREAAEGYLRAAHSVLEAEGRRTGFFDFPSWFVVHHLSFIAVELFVKSFRVFVTCYGQPDDSGFERETYEHAYGGHRVKFGRLFPEDVDALRAHLSPKQMAMLDNLATEDGGRLELARGRYPYEIEAGLERFPAGDAGRPVAEEWLELGDALQRFPGARFSLD